MPSQANSPHDVDAASQTPSTLALRLLTAIVAGLYVGIAALLGLVGVFDALVVLQRTLASVLIVVGGGQIVVSWLRIGLDHWKEEHLRGLLWRELGVGGVTVALVGALGWLLPVTPLALVLLLVPLVFVCAQLDVIATLIARGLAEAGPRSVTAYIRKCRLYGRVVGAGPREDFGELVDDARDGVVAHALSVLLEAPAKPAMSRVRIVTTTILLIAAFGESSLAFATLVVGDRPPAEEQSTNAKDNATTTTAEPPPLRPTTQDTPPSAPPPAPVTPSTASWDDTCATNPGADAPSWAAAELDRLYLGPIDKDAPPEQVGPPGAGGGCTGSVVVPDRTVRFAYVLGTDRVTSRLLSVAVTSDDLLPSALFLAPAAEPVRELIRVQGEVGGSPRYRVRHGDFQLAWTSAGTTAFVRTTVWTEDAGPKRAQPYTQLPPAATDAWLDAMRTKGSWLWPLATYQGSSTHIRLLDGAVAGREVAAIDYTDARGNAHLRQGSLSRDYAPSGNRVSDIELLDLSHTAR